MENRLPLRCSGPKSRHSANLSSSFRLVYLVLHDTDESATILSFLVDDVRGDERFGKCSTAQSSPPLDDSAAAPSFCNDIAAYDRPVVPDRYTFPPVNVFKMRSFTNFVVLSSYTGAFVNAFPQLKGPLPPLHNESPTLEKRVSFDASSVCLSLENFVPRKY